MKPYELNIKLSFLFLGVSIIIQIMIIFSILDIPYQAFALTTTYGAWYFMERAKESLKKEFQEIEDVI